MHANNARLSPNNAPIPQVQCSKRSGLRRYVHARTVGRCEDRARDTAKILPVPVYCPQLLLRDEG